MKKRMAWRFTCEYCGKSSCGGGHIARHERHCTKNPQRVCRMCERVGDKQATVAELIEAIEYGPVPGFADVDEMRISKLREVAHNCPACILTALRQVVTPDEVCGGGGDFNFKEESKAWIEDYREACLWSGYGEEDSRLFDREEWDAIRAKRFAKPEAPMP